MKKFIILTITTLIGLNIFAKDLNQLISEFPFNDTYSAKNTYILDNKADFDKEFNTFKSSELATVIYKNDAAADQKKLSIKAYMIFHLYYNLYNEEIANVPDYVAIQLNAVIFLNKSKSDTYAKLKKNGWKIDNYQLPQGKIIVCAFVMKDYDVIIDKMPGMRANVNNIWPMVKRNVLESASLDKSIKILDLIENEMLLSDSKDNLEELQTIKKALTMRKLSN